MSNKNKQLLNESTVRRFMGLAGIGALTDKFVGDKQINEEVEELEEQPLPDAEPELDAGPPLPGEMAEPGPDAGLPPEELGLEDEDPVEDVDLSQEEADVLISLGKKLEAEMGGEEEGLEGEEGLEDLGGELPPAPGPEELAESLIHELTARVSKRVKKEYVVNEVMKRVATRLQRASKPRRKRRKR